jgi:phosphoglucosamine mutase
MTRLFGTDGIRGIANRDLTPELALRLGRAAGHVLGGAGHRVVIGRDTRRSGRMLESALAAGLCSVGMEVRLVGHIPTPGLAYLTKTDDFVAGAVISASHNPAPDNGIKFFDHKGLKLADAVEDRIEALMATDDAPRPEEGGIGLVGDARGLVKTYEDFLAKNAPRLEGMRVVLDCANGATYRVAPGVFAHSGAEVITLCDGPDGLNINDGCGSTYPEKMQAAVREHRADIGFAFDGDGDRIVMADARGELHDGDTVLALVARHFARACRAAESAGCRRAGRRSAAAGHTLSARADRPSRPGPTGIRSTSRARRGARGRCAPAGASRQPPAATLRACPSRRRSGRRTRSSTCSDRGCR